MIPAPAPDGGEFCWTPEHTQLRAALRDLLARHAPIARTREIAEAGRRHDPELWRRLALGVGAQGLVVPEEHGGAGGTLLDLAIVADEMGRVLLGGPFFATVALAVPALLASGDSAAQAEYLPQIADGSLTVALATGPGAAADNAVTVDARGRLTGVIEPVLDGADADLLLVPARAGTDIGLHAVEAGAPGLARDTLDTLDVTRRAGRTTFARTPARPVGPPAGGVAAVEEARRVASVLMAAEQVGGMDACVGLTAEYARTRRQFGRPIGSFQAVKHRLADMAVRLEMARSAAYWAAWQPLGTDGFAAAAAIARSFCSEAYLDTALDTVQLHGGIGFTWEHDAHLFVRRARADLSVLQTPGQAREGLAGAVLAAAGIEEGSS